MTDWLTGRPDAGALPEVSDGLVLWRLRCGDQQLWCQVEDVAEALAARVYSPATGETVVWEFFDTAAALVEGADAFRNNHLAAGWVEVDVDEPD